MAIYKITEKLTNIKITGGKCNTNWVYDTMQDSVNISIVINGKPCKFIFWGCHGRYVLDGIDCNRVKIGDDLYSQDVTRAGGGNKNYALYIPSNIMKSAPKSAQTSFSFTGQYYSTKPAIKYFKELLKSLLTEHPEYFEPDFLKAVGLEPTNLDEDVFKQTYSNYDSDDTNSFIVKSSRIAPILIDTQSTNESVEISEGYTKGDWVEVNLNTKKNGTPNIIPVKVDSGHGKTFLGWAWGERQNEYPISAIVKKIDSTDTDEIIKKYTPDGFMHEANKPTSAQKYKNYYIVADPAGDGYNVFDINKNLEDEGYGTVEDAKAFIDTLDESFDVVGYPTRSMSFDELTKLIKRNLDSDFISLAYNGKAGAGKYDVTFTRIDGSWTRTNKKGEPLNRDTINEINSLRLSNSEVFKELLYCIKNNDVFNLTLGYESNEELTETLKEGRLTSSYDKTQLENDLLALNDIDKVDWDLSAYDELGEVIVLTHRAFEDSLDMSTYYMQRTNLLREILKVFDKNNLKLVDPIEDQGTWWYFVLEHKNPIENSDKPKFEYMMVEFFETSGTPADDIMRRTKDIKYTDLSKLSEILVNADKIFRDIDEYGGCNKVYFDNYIRYQGKLYKFHAGRVDIGDGPAEVSIPANYPEQVINYFLSELESGNKDIPVVEE